VKASAAAAVLLRGHIGWVVAGSLAAGLVAAALLVEAPFIPPTDAGVTGVVLCGLALGWAMLAVLSVRFTDRITRSGAGPNPRSPRRLGGTRESGWQSDPSRE
jgi:hypothetical protein